MNRAEVGDRVMPISLPSSVESTDLNGEESNRQKLIRRIQGNLNIINARLLMMLTHPWLSVRFGVTLSHGWIASLFFPLSLLNHTCPETRVTIDAKRRTAPFPHSIARGTEKSGTGSLNFLTCWKKRNTASISTRCPREATHSLLKCKWCFEVSRY